MTPIMSCGSCYDPNSSMLESCRISSVNGTLTRLVKSMSSSWKHRPEGSKCGNTKQAGSQFRVQGFGHSV